MTCETSSFGEKSNSRYLHKRCVDHDDAEWKNGIPQIRREVINQEVRMMKFIKREAFDWPTGQGNHR